MSAPEPTAQDFENARIRADIAVAQAHEYGEALKLAISAFGLGWRPRCRHMLVEKEAEERSRRTGERTVPSAVVYTVEREATGERKHFTVEDGRVVEHATMEAGFGAMLLEPHPTRGFEHKGQWHRTHRYSLCFSPYVLYEPKTAQELAALRVSRERGKAEREERQFVAENPLLAWGERVQGEEEERGRGI